MVKKGGGRCKDSQGPVMKPLCELRLMVQILHDLKGLKLWELWYTPYYA